MCRACSLADTLGWWISEAQWLALLCHPTVSERFWQRQSQRLRDLYQWQVMLARGSVRARVAWQLLHLAERFGQAGQNGEIFVPVHLPQEQQALLVGATRPAGLAGLWAPRLLYQEHRGPEGGKPRRDLARNNFVKKFTAFLLNISLHTNAFFLNLDEGLTEGAAGESLERGRGHRD